MPELEARLRELNEIIARGRGERTFEGPKYPTVLIVGCARSGTTVLLQWLAASGCFAYPSNLASRAYGSARFAALLQRTLIDLDAREEIVPAASRVPSYDSVLGKTRGAAQPHEFWYFWRRFFSFGANQRLSPEEWDRSDTAGLLAELAAFEDVFDKPIAMKAMILNWNLDRLAALLDRPLIVNVQRDVTSNAASLLRARETFSGSRADWYSFRPPEYELLVTRSPEEQVVGQVIHTQRAILEGLSRVAPEHQLTVSHERFCADPRTVWRELGERLEQLGYPVPDYRGPESFPLSAARPDDALTRAVRDFETGTRG